MYKDKDKQREAQRNWVRQKRIDKKGSTPGSIKEGTTSGDTRVIPKTFQENAMDILEEKTEPERTAQGNVRVSKLGDDDYVPGSTVHQFPIEGEDFSKSRFKPLCRTDTF